MSDFTLQWIINANTEATIPSGIVQLPDIFGTGATGTWGINISGHAAGAPPTGAAGGDLGGTYPNPSVVQINGASLGTTTTTSGNILIGSGTQWVTHAVSGDITLSSTGTATIGSNVVTYGKIQEASATTLIGNPTGSLANVEEITLGSTLAFSGTALETTALTGDVTASANSFATTLATVNSNVGSFGSASEVGTFTVNAKGLITAASNVTISGVPPGGAAGGDLSGTYPNPTVAKINGVSLGSTTATSGNLLIGSGTAWVTNAMSGDITINSSGVTAIGALKVTNSMIANTTIDLTTKVTGILPNANTTATSSNAINTIIERDGSGNFSAGTITATLNGLSNNTLQNDYDNGTGIITTVSGKQLTINCGNDLESPIIVSALTNSGIIFNSSASATNSKNWMFSATSGGNFDGLLINDALTSTVSWMQINRTGTTVNFINFPTGTLQYGGAEVATKSYVTTQLNAFTGTTNIVTVGTIVTGTWSGLFGAVTGANLTHLTAANIDSGTAGINISGNAATVTTNANLTGDVTSVGNATTLATTNINTGSFGDATHVGQFTVNGKGLITAASSVTITGTSPGGAAGGDLTGTYPNPTIAANAVTYAKLQQVAASSLVGNPTGSLANAQGITLGSTLTFVSTALQTLAITGDVTASANSFATTVAKINGVTLGSTTATSGNLLIGSGTQWVTNAMSGDITINSTGVTAIGSNKVTLAQMAQMATASFLGRNTASTGNVEVLSEATAKTMLNLSGTNSGDVTLSGENYISLSGQALTAAAVNLSGTNATGILAAARFPALTGDVTTSSGAIATTVAANAITYAKFQQVAASSLVGNATGSLANATGITLGSTLTFVSTALQTLAITGDVTASANSFATTIATNAVTYAKFQQVAASSLVGNPTGSLANAQGITLGTSLTFSSSTINTIQGIRTADSPTFVGLTVNTIVSAAATILALSSPAPATNVDAVGITIIASNGTGSGSSAGGPITITSGNGSGASGANGGSISITTGNGSSGASPGTLTMKAGTSSVTGGITNVQGGAGGTSSSGGGQLNLLGGAAPGLGTGGNAVITGGSASTFGTGGDVIITGGAAGTSAEAGNVRIRGGIATSGTQGAVIFDQGSVNITGLTASNIVMTDASKNLISSSSLTLYAANDSYTYTNCGGL